MQNVFLGLTKDSDGLDQLREVLDREINSLPQGEQLPARTDLENAFNLFMQDNEGIEGTGSTHAGGKGGSLVRIKTAAVGLLGLVNRLERHAATAGKPVEQFQEIKKSLQHAEEHPETVLEVPAGAQVSAATQSETPSQTQSDSTPSQSVGAESAVPPPTGSSSGTPEKKDDPEKKSSTTLPTGMHIFSTEELMRLVNSARGASDKKDKKSVLETILGPAMLGVLGVGKYYADKADREERRKNTAEMLAELKALREQRAANPNDENLKTDEQKKLAALLTQQRTNVIAEAAKSIKKDKEARLKTANDIGLNYGNFGRIFGSGTNRDSLHGVSDLSHVLNIQSKQVNPYL
jgi:hypothetical protein